MSVNAKMTAIADEVRTLSGATDKLSLDEMASHTREANTEVSEQAELIQQLKSILQGKTEGGVPEDLSAELNEQEALLEELKDVLRGKASGAGSTPVAKALIRRGIGYIDTGIDAANSNLTIQVRYEFEKMPTGYWYLIRAYVNESTNSTRILFNGTASTFCCLNSVPSSSLSTTRTRYAGVVYTDVLQPESSNRFSYTTDGSKTTKARTSGEAIVGQNVLLFTNATSKDNTVAKVYYLKIYDGETLVRDFIPFITRDGECGLYDLVTKQFYGNCGDGKFDAETVEVAK